MFKKLFKAVISRALDEEEVPKKPENLNLIDRQTSTSKPFIKSSDSAIQISSKRSKAHLIVRKNSYDNKRKMRESFRVRQTSITSIQSTVDEPVDELKRTVGECNLKSIMYEKRGVDDGSRDKKRGRRGSEHPDKKVTFILRPRTHGKNKHTSISKSRFTKTIYENEETDIIHMLPGITSDEGSTSTSTERSCCTNRRVNRRSYSDERTNSSSTISRRTLSTDDKIVRKEATYKTKPRKSESHRLKRDESLPKINKKCKFHSQELKTVSEPLRQSPIIEEVCEESKGSKNQNKEDKEVKHAKRLQSEDLTAKDARTLSVFSRPSAIERSTSTTGFDAEPVRKHNKKVGRRRPKTSNKATSTRDLTVEEESKEIIKIDSVDEACECVCLLSDEKIQTSETILCCSKEGLYQAYVKERVAILEKGIARSRKQRLLPPEVSTWLQEKIKIITPSVICSSTMTIPGACEEIIEDVQSQHLETSLLLLTAVQSVLKEGTISAMYRAEAILASMGLKFETSQQIPKESVECIQEEAFACEEEQNLNIKKEEYSQFPSSSQKEGVSSYVNFQNTYTLPPSSSSYFSFEKPENVKTKIPHDCCCQRMQRPDQELLGGYFQAQINNYETPSVSRIPVFIDRQRANISGHMITSPVQDDTFLLQTGPYGTDIVEKPQKRRGYVSRIPIAISRIQKKKTQVKKPQQSSGNDCRCPKCSLSRIPVAVSRKDIVIDIESQHYDLNQPEASIVTLYKDLSLRSYPSSVSHVPVVAEEPSARTAYRVSRKKKSFSKVPPKPKRDANLCFSESDTESWVTLDEEESRLYDKYFNSSVTLLPGENIKTKRVYQMPPPEKQKKISKGSSLKKGQSSCDIPETSKPETTSENCLVADDASEIADHASITSSAKTVEIKPAQVDKSIDPCGVKPSKDFKPVSSRNVCVQTIRSRSIQSVTESEKSSKPTEVHNIFVQKGQEWVKLEDTEIMEDSSLLALMMAECSKLCREGGVTRSQESSWSTLGDEEAKHFEKYDPSSVSLMSTETSKTRTVYVLTRKESSSQTSRLTTKEDDGAPSKPGVSRAVFVKASKSSKSESASSTNTSRTIMKRKHAAPESQQKQ